MSFTMLDTSKDSNAQESISMTIYSSTKALPYVYICTHKETGKFYIGYRMGNVKLNTPSHLDLPKYKTSSKIVRPNWQDYTPTILAEFFDPSHAYSFEQQMIFDNWKNPLLLNKHYANDVHKQFRCTGHSDATKQKLKKPRGPQSVEICLKKSKPHSDETRQKMRKPRSDEHKQNMRKPHGPHKQVECPHCGTIGGISAMKRWHFDTCPKKPY